MLYPEHQPFYTYILPYKAEKSNHFYCTDLPKICSAVNKENIRRNGFEFWSIILKKG